MSEKPTVEENLILAHIQAIGIAHRALIAKLDLRRENRDAEVRGLLATIAEEATKIEALINEHPVLGAYRDGYAAALTWVLSFSLDSNVEDSIREALES